MNPTKKKFYKSLRIISAIVLFLSFLYTSSSSLYTALFISQSSTINNADTSIIHSENDYLLRMPLPFYETKQPFLKMNLSYSFYSNSGKIAQKEILCRLNVSNNCKMKYVAEVVESFWIVSPIYSPYQTKTSIRYELHNNFQSYVHSMGMSISTLEALRMDRDQKYLLTSPGREPYEIQTQIYDDIYIRENLLNVAAKKIAEKQHWEYLGWIDAHHLFDNVYWWEDAIVDMEKYASIQLFRMLTWKGWSNESWWSRPGAIYASHLKNNLTYGEIPYFGNAYSVRREIYDAIGEIFDRGIGGCCDCAYVKASLGDDVIFDYMNQWPHYTSQFYPWINKVAAIFKGQRKGVRGDVVHLPHESNFLYFSLMEYFDGNKFDIYSDLTVDKNGTLMLNNTKFRDVIEFYSRFANYRFEIIVCLVLLGILVATCCLYGLYRYRQKKNPKNLKSTL